LIKNGLKYGGTKMNLSDEQKVKIFDAIYHEYVEEHGLGGMSKTDLDALIVYLIVNEIGEINSFDLSNVFLTTEGRLKSLLERAAVKFDKRTIEEAWLDLLDILIRIDFDIESLEKGQIRFQLSDPMLFRWLQDQVRNLGSTVTYHKSSEQVTMNLETLYKVLDILWEEKGLSDQWTGDLLLVVQEKIQIINGKIGEKIEKNLLEDLRERKQPKLMRNLETASQLASIGSLLIPLVDKIKK
jgi:hypothetical protein